jgi:hypothetical protein
VFNLILKLFNDSSCVTGRRRRAKRIHLQISVSYVAPQALNMLTSVVVTPEGLEYYTPLSPVGTRNTSQQTPQSFTPATKLSTFARALYEYMKSDPLTAILLDYDRHVRATKIIEVVRGSHEEGKARRRKKRNARKAQHDGEEEQSDIEKRNQRQKKQKRLAHRGLQDLYGDDLKRHRHLGGHFSAAGNSRFALGDTLQAMLWQARILARSVCDAIDACEEQRPTLQRDLPAGDNPPEAPQYWLTAQPEAFLPQDIGPLLDLIKRNDFVRHVLGVTQVDYSRWTGTWNLVEEDHVVQALSSTSDHLFGDLHASYPSWQSISILVRFTLQQPKGEPFMMRFSFGQDIKAEYTDCRMCENMFVIVESIGPSGALKIKIPMASDDEGTTYGSLEDFEAAHHLQSRILTSRWSTLAYQLQGSALLNHYCRCFCNGSVHQNGFKKHYIDMSKEEITRKGVWEPNPDRVGEEEAFESHPLEPQGSGRIFIENDDESDAESEDDHWDPNGGELDAFEVFDPNPDEVEVEAAFLSSPQFLRVLG